MCNCQTSYLKPISRSLLEKENSLYFIIQVRMAFRLRNVTDANEKWSHKMWVHFLGAENET